MPKVSVIIPTYNCAQYIREAMDSALTQSFNDYEIIVVDDGSTDNTKQIIENYCRRYGERVRYVFQQNQGMCVARNNAIRAMRGEYIALLDADDRWKRDRLEEGVRILDANPEIGLLHSGFIRIDETGRDIGIPQVKECLMSGEIFKRLLLREMHISTPTTIFRKACCDSIGLFDENLTRLGAEDRDLWLRISLQYKVYYINKVLAEYRVRASSLSRKYERMMEGRIYIINKFCSDGSGYSKLRSRALASAYKDLGDTYLFQQEFQKARQQYLKSIMCWPFSIWPGINFLKAAFKIRVIKKPVW